MDAHRQSPYSLRTDWGSAGADAICAGCDVAVVVDVLSFSTTLTVAADRGVAVLPFPWRDERAVDHAAERGATLAVGRSEAGPGQVSLSPGTVRAAPELSRLVLPSPNGSTLAFRLRAVAQTVIGVGLRNRRAAADHLLERRASFPGLRVAVVAAGERWPDGSLRPAVEDLWGAGALIDALGAAGWPDVSPEARAAAAAFREIADDPAAALRDCASGRELAAIGFADDVRVASELDRSPSVPRLVGDMFEP
ncbi:2-phosphosulfolactate phosphatase [Pseudonocardia nematodicida]|uniref:Probable 2-phosphosulfolactate phosphatase n=1 Tax=Pseudonocardia nematodicida TaxID=1206997 RepID=A0ABV1K6I8_9PSEU